MAKKLNNRKPLTEKIKVEKRVNNGGYYHPKTGKFVGAYRKTMKVYPKTYKTWIRDSKGEFREAIARKETKNGKTIIYYQFIEDHRKAKLIPLEKAKKHFESLPDKRRQLDRKRTAKNKLEIIEKDGKKFVKESYLTETGTSRYDIDNIDTALNQKERGPRLEKEILSTKSQVIEDRFSLIRNQYPDKQDRFLLYCLEEERDPEKPFKGYEYIIWIDRIAQEYKTEKGISRDKSIMDQDDFTAYVKKMVNERILERERAEKETSIDEKYLKELRTKREPLFQEGKTIEKKLLELDEKAGDNRTLGIILRYPRGKEQEELVEAFKQNRRSIAQLEDYDNQLKLRKEAEKEIKKEEKERQEILNDKIKTLHESTLKKESEIRKTDLDINLIIKELGKTNRGTKKYNALKDKLDRLKTKKGEAIKERDALYSEKDKLLLKQKGIKFIEPKLIESESLERLKIKNFFEEKGYKKDKEGNYVKGNLIVKLDSHSFSVKRKVGGLEVTTYGGNYEHFEIDSETNKLRRNEAGKKHLEMEKQAERGLIIEKAKELPKLKGKEKYYIISIDENSSYARYISQTIKPEKAMQEYLDNKKFNEKYNTKNTIMIIPGNDIDHVRNIIYKQKKEKEQKEDYRIIGNTYIHKGMLRSLGLKWDYRNKAWRGKLSEADLKNLEAYSDLTIEKDKEYTKTEREKSFEVGKLKKESIIQEQYEKTKEFENNYRPFTPAEVSHYNNYTHYPTNINDRYESDIKKKEQELLGSIGINSIKELPLETRTHLNNYKKAIYNYYLEESRARATAPPISVVGRSGYKNHERKIQRADIIRKKAIDKVEKAEKRLRKNIYKNISEEKKQKQKVVDFGVKGKNINSRISKLRKEEGLEISQTSRGSSYQKEYRIYHFKSPDNKEYVMSVSETGNLSIHPYNRPSEELVSKEIKTLEDMDLTVKQFLESRVEIKK